MIQLQVISGKQAGLLWDARRFPFRVGRAPEADLRLEEAGIWDNHFQVHVQADTGFSLTAHPGALVAINQTPVESARLRNGDIITAGAAQIAFRLSPTRPASLRAREWFVWGLLLAVTIGQIGLVVWLLQA